MEKLNERTRRLFIGFSIDQIVTEHFHDSIRKLQESLSSQDFIRWGNRANYHVTLSFLGQQPESKLSEISTSLEQIARRFQPILVKAMGFGAFPRIRSARIGFGMMYESLAVSGAGPGPLAHLVREIEDHMIKLDVLSSRERENYIPHITLFRSKSPVNLEKAFAPFLEESFGEGKIREISLYESLSGNSVPKYVPLHSYPLSG